MASLDMGVIRELPGYKVILKAVLKSQIQQLIDHLAACTDEESVILTASVSDGSLSHLGSESGKCFLQENDDVKSKFLGFCLKRFHVKVQQERDEPLRSYRLTQSRQTHRVGATRNSTRTFQRHQPYSSNRKAFKSSSENLVVPLSIVANTAKETKPNVLATVVVELDKDAGTASFDSAEQSDANESDFPENTTDNNTSLPAEDPAQVVNTPGAVDNNDSGVNVQVKVESGTDVTGIHQDQNADSGWDPDGSMDMAQYSTEASGSSPGLCMEDHMSHHNADPNTAGDAEFTIFTQTPRRLSRTGEQHVCGVCLKSFTFVTNLIRHRHLHSNVKTLSCRYCEYKSTRKDHIKQHVLTMHKDKEVSGSCDQTPDAGTETRPSPQNYSCPTFIPTSNGSVDPRN